MPRAVQRGSLAPLLSLLLAAAGRGRSALALVCSKTGVQGNTVEECPQGAACLLEFFRNQFAGGLPTCGAAGCYLGDPAALVPSAAAVPGADQSFHVCNSTDQCNVPPGAAANASLCKNFPAPQAFALPNATAGNSTASRFAGPVDGSVPLGIIAGNLRTDLRYRTAEESVTFSLAFPDSIAWVGFQFYSLTGGTDALQDLQDNGSPTAGYECLVQAGQPSPRRVECRGRELRHVLPTVALPSPAMRGSVWECTPEYANNTWPVGTNTSLCRYSQEPRLRSLGIATGPMSFIADVMLPGAVDMQNMSVTYQDGYYNATWTRSRAYPWQLDATIINMRWAVAPGPNAWIVGDLPFHGVNGNGTYIRGTDFMFADPVAHAARETSCYDASRHANMFAPRGQACAGGGGGGTSTTTATMLATNYAIAGGRRAAPLLAALTVLGLLVAALTWL